MFSHKQSCEWKIARFFAEAILVIYMNRLLCGASGAYERAAKVRSLENVYLSYLFIHCVFIES